MTATVPLPSDFATRSELLEALIEFFAGISEPGRGVTRLAYSPMERQAHAAFADYMRRLGLSVQQDAAGNTIAELAGTDTDQALGTGSHLDSVPRGGCYDGIAGVVAAMAAAAELSAQSLRHAVRFVAFAGEEGARFGQACLGSRLATGLSTTSDLERLHDADGIHLADAFRGVGLDPDRVDEARWQPHEWAAFVELHVEQGAVLASTETQIGIVDVISGSTRFALDWTGRASHSGGTPMHLRADALAASAEFILAAEHLANDNAHDGTRVTVGRLTVEPGSITTIPGHCHGTVDVRDVNGDRQRATARELVRIAEQIGARRGITVVVEQLGESAPVKLSTSVSAVLRDAAVAQGCSVRVMPSGAGHDTQMVSTVCPAGMLFVPSQHHGVSHAPEEFTRTVDLDRGVDVLLAGLRALDTTILANPAAQGAA